MKTLSDMQIRYTTEYVDHIGSDREVRMEEVEVLQYKKLFSDGTETEWETVEHEYS